MDWSILITAIAGIIGTIGSGFGTYIFTRRKYNTEVDSAKIDNLSKIIQIQSNQLDNLTKRLDLALARNQTLEKEVVALRQQMYNLMSSICMDFTCKIRKADDSLLKEFGKIPPVYEDKENTQE